MKRFALLLAAMTELIDQFATTTALHDGVVTGP